MATQRPTRLADLAVDFNERLERNDGESVAKILYDLLARDRSAWLDGCLLPIFDDVASSTWPGRDRANCESAAGAKRRVFRPSRRPSSRARRVTRLRNKPSGLSTGACA